MSTGARPPIDVSGSRPGSIDPDGDYRPPRNYQQQQAPQKSGTNWMPGIAGAVIAIIAAAVMVFFLNPNKTAINTLAQQVAETNNRITVLDASLNAPETGLIPRFEQSLSNSSSYLTQGSLDGLTAGMATQQSVTDLGNLVVSLNTKIDALTARVALLEVPPEETPTEDSELPSWSFRNPPGLSGYTVGTGANPPGNGFSTESLQLRVERIKISEAGTYEFYLEIANRDELLPSNPDSSISIQLVLIPNGDALLDEDTAIYTDDMPDDGDWYSVDWIDWEDADFTQVTKGGKEITRRVTFETENFSIPSIEADESVELFLVLELQYAK